MFEGFCHRHVGLSYDEGRRHIQLWLHWYRCLATLERLEQRAIDDHVAFSIPGLRRPLALAGVVGKRPLPPPPEKVEEPDLIELSSSELPEDLGALKVLIRHYQQRNRVLREQNVLLRNEVVLLTARIRQMPKHARTRPT
jgi:hypothetical protein